MNIVNTSKSAAAIECLNGRARSHDPHLKSLVRDLKSQLSIELCKQGYMTDREYIERGNREHLCKLTFKIGKQFFTWAVLARQIPIELTPRNPPSPYDGPPADKLLIAVMSDTELLKLLVVEPASSPSASKATDSRIVDDVDQQLAWLKQYHADSGLWPTRDAEYPAGNPIGYRLSTWRASYIRGTLDWRVVSRLNLMGLPWDGKSHSWYPRYFAARDFLLTEGRWPSSSSKYPLAERELALWLSGQRNSFVRGELASDKKILLDVLNFDWGRYSRMQERYARGGTGDDE